MCIADHMHAFAASPCQSEIPLEVLENPHCVRQARRWQEVIQAHLRSRSHSPDSDTQTSGSTLSLQHTVQPRACQWRARTVCLPAPILTGIFLSRSVSSFSSTFPSDLTTSPYAVARTWLIFRSPVPRMSCKRQRRNLAAVSPPPMTGGDACTVCKARQDRCGALP